jgi:hypothetical protein
MVEMPSSGLKAATYWHPSNILHCVAARARPLFSSAADGSIALTYGHLDKVCMSKYMYKSMDKLSNSVNTPHKETVKTTPTPCVCRLRVKLIVI